MITDIQPDDEANRKLVHHVHPHDWPVPRPSERYGLVVIGGGPAGLVCAFGAAGLGARVALVERGLLGGDCLNWGCVPSKALIASAKAAKDARRAAALGVHVGEVRVDFGEVMARMRKVRADISHHDSATRLRDAGVDVFFGAASFSGPDSVEVAGQTLRFSRAVIATGARASTPPIPGLADVRAVDNEGLFQLAELPRRLVVLGAGPIGAEMAQAFARFGSEVTIVDQAPRVLPREVAEASDTVAAALVEDGVRLLLGARVLRCERRGEESVVVATVGDETVEVVGDRVLVALGRRANVDGLRLDAAGVRLGPTGVEVDAWLRTSNAAIYACGDVAGRHQFTHAADAQARLVLQNALFLPTKKVDSLVIPWATYTDPEVAWVGPPAAEVVARGDLRTLRVELADNDRARCEGEITGFAQVWVDGRGRIVAATVVGPRAGDLIQPLVIAKTQGLSMSALGGTVAAYPNHVEVTKRLADAWNRTRLTPTAAAWLRRILRWRHGAAAVRP